MNWLMELYFFLLVTIIIFLVDYFVFLRPKVKKSKRKNQAKMPKELLEVVYLSKRFKLKKENLMKKSIMVWIAVINSTIISLVSAIIHLIPINIILQLLIGVVLLLALLYSLYEIFGRILAKKGY